MKKVIRCAEQQWIDWNKLDLDEIDDDEVFDLILTYLNNVETEVNEELEVFSEPAGTGMFTTVYFSDESGQDTFETFGIDEIELENIEIDMAQKSSNAAEYANLYKEWLRGMIAKNSSK